jgi:predicted NBD/HSP70 family sugar kinase
MTIFPKTKQALEGSFPTGLKYANRKLVLDAFRENDILSSVDVSKLIGVSRQTASKGIDFFVEKGLLKCIGKGDSTEIGGRPPEQYSLSEEIRFICINVESESIIVRLINLHSKITKTVEHTIPLKIENEKLWRNIKDMVSEIISDMKDETKIRGVCFTIRGTVKHNAGTLQYSTYYTSWAPNEPIREKLQAIFPWVKRFIIDKPVKIFAQSFFSAYEKQLQEKRCLVIYSQKGIGAGLIDNGVIEDGANSLIGEIGHMILEPKFPLTCSCGNNGCFEQLVGINQMRSIVMERASDFKESILVSKDTSLLTYEDIFNASRKGDELAHYLCDYMAEYFSIMFRNTVVVFDPEVIVLQGNFAHADEYFLDKFQDKIRRFRYFDDSYSIQIIIDKRDISELLSNGSINAIIMDFFSDPDIYV